MRTAPAPWRRAFSTRLSSAWRQASGGRRRRPAGGPLSTTSVRPRSAPRGRTRPRTVSMTACSGDPLAADRQRVLVQSARGPAASSASCDEAVGLLGGRATARAQLASRVGVSPARSSSSALEDRQRRAQLVARIGHEGALALAARASSRASISFRVVAEPARSRRRPPGTGRRASGSVGGDRRRPAPHRLDRAQRRRPPARSRRSAASSSAIGPPISSAPRRLAQRVARGLAGRRPRRRCAGARSGDRLGEQTRRLVATVVHDAPVEVACRSAAPSSPARQQRRGSQPRASRRARGRRGRATCTMLSPRSASRLPRSARSERRRSRDQRATSLRAKRSASSSAGRGRRRGG